MHNYQNHVSKTCWKQVSEGYILKIWIMHIYKYHFSKQQMLKAHFRRIEFAEMNHAWLPTSFSRIVEKHISEESILKICIIHNYQYHFSKFVKSKCQKNRFWKYESHINIYMYIGRSVGRSVGGSVGRAGGRAGGRWVGRSVGRFVDHSVAWSVAKMNSTINKYLDFCNVIYSQLLVCR